MRFTAAAFTALLATSAYAASIADLVAQIPACAVTCVAEASTAAGCGITDYECQCGPKKEDITSGATPCVLGACTPEEAVQVLGITGDICVALAAEGGETEPESEPTETEPSGTVASSIPAPTGTQGPVFTGAAGKFEAKVGVVAAVAAAAYML
jgi:hypothetical protein